MRWAYIAGLLFSVGFLVYAFINGQAIYVESTQKSAFWTSVWPVLYGAQFPLGFQSLSMFRKANFFSKPDERKTAAGVLHFTSIVASVGTILSAAFLLQAGDPNGTMLVQIGTMGVSLALQVFLFAAMNKGNMFKKRGKAIPAEPRHGWEVYVSILSAVGLVVAAAFAGPGALREVAASEAADPLSTPEGAAVGLLAALPFILYSSWSVVLPDTLSFTAISGCVGLFVAGIMLVVEPILSKTTVGTAFLGWASMALAVISIIAVIVAWKRT